MPFKFRLEPLITIRDNVLKDKQAELAKAYEALRIINEALQKVEAERQENFEAGRKIIHEGGSVDPRFLLGIRRQEMFLIAQSNDIKKKIKMVEEEIERRRDAVMEANKELKIVEKLKEKRREKYHAELAKKETVQMDEIAQTRIQESDSHVR